MPEPTTAFIDPKAVLGALTVQPFEPHLGPSGPHDHDDPVEAQVAVNLGGATPGLALNPGTPPLVSAAHYTQILDQLWPEFDDPEERTAARLNSLLEDVIDEGQRVLLLKQDVWEKLPSYKVPESERQRFDKEFLAYLRRLQEYKKTLADLEPDSTATDSVYIGLVKRRDGAGPVPDAIMHMYFAQQLGILADHADEMGQGFVGRVMDGLARVDAVIDRAADAVERAEQDAANKLDSWWDRVTRPWKIAGGVLLGVVAVVGGVVLVDKLRDREPQP